MTTINDITNSIRQLSNIKNYHLVIVGDKKTPNLKSDKFTYLSLKKQSQLPFHFIKNCPENSYQRKNIGYLYSFLHNANLIFETDDDNIPLKNWDSCLNFRLEKSKLVTSPNIFNVYSKFSKEKIWPRGYPLTHITKQIPVNFKQSKKPHVGIWQGLVNHEPDVDAIYRLTINKKIQFKKNMVILNSNVYSPFNSQNTFWNEDFFHYMYLPISVTFRMTDILRGYIAQRCIWEHKSHLGFFGPNMKQFRNPHNLLNDFSLEIPCYTQIDLLIDILDNVKLSSNPKSNLTKIYQKLYKNGIVKKTEITALKNWFKDIENIKKHKIKI